MTTKATAKLSVTSATSTISVQPTISTASRPAMGLFYLWPAYQDAGHIPNIATCKGLTNPYITGILIRQTWALLEPNADGNYDWTYLDACASACQAAGKMFAFQHLAGYRAPAGLFNIPGVNYLDLTGIGKTAIVWDPTTFAKWEALQTAMAARYRPNPKMAYAVMSLIGRASESFLTNDSDPEDYDEATTLAQSMGYASAESAWEINVNLNTDMMNRVWHPKPVVYTTGVPFPNAESSQDAVMAHGNDNARGFRSQFGVRRNDLSHAGPPDNSYVSITSPYCIASGYQPTQTQRTNDPSPPTFFGQMMSRGLGFRAKLIEVFPGDVDVWQTEPATATILQNALTQMGLR